MEWVQSDACRAANHLGGRFCHVISRNCVFNSSLKWSNVDGPVPVLHSAWHPRRKCFIEKRHTSEPVLGFVVWNFVDLAVDLLYTAVECGRSNQLSDMSVCVRLSTGVLHRRECHTRATAHACQQMSVHASVSPVRLTTPLTSNKANQGAILYTEDLFAMRQSRMLSPAFKTTKLIRGGGRGGGSSNGGGGAVVDGGRDEGASGIGTEMRAERGAALHWAASEASRTRLTLTTMICSR